VHAPEDGRPDEGPLSWSPGELQGREVVVVGLARSGVSAANLLLRQGARVVATDTRPARELPEQVVALQERGVRLELGGHRPESFTGASLVVVSPGVPWDAPILIRARQAGTPVIAEIELGYRCARGRVVAITGTKGKSTTAAALGAMLRAADGAGDVRVGGNIGTALTSLVEGATPRTTFVVEVSSFQLEGTDTFHPEIALFLNLEADHLDRHRTVRDYAAAKARVFRNQTPADWAVVNADDPGVLTLARAGRGRLLPFSATPLQGEGAFFLDGEARLRREGRDECLFPETAIRLPGRHLALDLLAAGAAARLLGAPPDALARAVAGFAGSDHVLAEVAEHDGVRYFDDSKATNVAATRRGLEAFASPVLAILGGRSKGGDFRQLREPVARHARAVLLIGEAAEEIASALEGTVPLRRCGSMEEAVSEARARARPGDVVLLSPGCASFDMFADYAERGRSFQRAVRVEIGREPSGTES
jgi:UDP-N-acetylmuramoylalanine--D-glutamate ligase